MTEVPQNKLVQWIEYRLPIFGFLNAQLVDYPTPRNLSYWWNFGSLAGIALMLQIVTGIVLAFHYTPHADLAFDSVEHIMRNVNYGWLLRYGHANGASLFFAVVYIHLFRGLYYGSYKAPRELLWWFGILTLLAMMGSAFTGYVLPWGQMSYWAATVITNLFTAIPWIGEAITTLLWGGFVVDNPTLVRFYSLHYLLPFVIVGLVVVHLWALHVHHSNNPLGIDMKGPQDSLPFHPYYTIKDLFGLGVFLLVLAGFVFFAPNVLGEADNYIPANSLVTPTHIVPEWYFLPYYAILRAIPDKLLGVVAMFGSILILFAVPWLDTSRVRSARFRPWYKVAFWLFAVVAVVLGWVGKHTPDDILRIGEIEISFLIIGRAATAYYFAHFLIVMPILGKIEPTRPLPDSIATPVLKGGGELPSGATAAKMEKM